MRGSCLTWALLAAAAAIASPTKDELYALILRADQVTRRRFETRESDPNIEIRGGGASRRHVRPRNVKGRPEFLDEAPGNGIWISPHCLNSESNKVESKCKSNALKCGHAHVQVEQEQIGKYVSFWWDTVHSSRYSMVAVTYSAQFFFSLAVDVSRVLALRRRCTGRDKGIRRPYVEGGFEQQLSLSVGKRVVHEWSGTFANRTASSANVSTFDGKSLDDDTKVWPKDIIDSKLEARCLLYE